MRRVRAVSGEVNGNFYIGHPGTRPTTSEPVAASSAVASRTEVARSPTSPGLIRWIRRSEARPTRGRSANGWEAR